MTDNLQGVLEWVNGQRSQFGLSALAELPAGDIGTGWTCPLARALGGGGNRDVYVGTTWYVPCWWSNAIRSLPTGIVQFVADVDAGKHPELIVAPTEDDARRNSNENLPQ